MPLGNEHQTSSSKAAYTTTLKVPPWCEGLKNMKTPITSQGLPPHSNKLNEKEKAAVGCPWDGRKPVWESERVGLRSDPGRAVRLRCPKCGVSKGTVLSEAEESAASKLRMRDYPHSEISHQEASVQVVRDEVLKAWNKRK